MFKLLKKEDLKKLGNWFKLGSGSKGKSDLKAVIGTGAVKLLLDFIEELVQEAPNKAKLKGSGIGFLALAGTLLGLDTLEGKRTEANNNEKIRVKTEADKSEANKYESNCKAEADAYAQKRQADAELYEAKAKVDVWKAEALNRINNTVQENQTTEPTVESPSSSQMMEETFMQSFNRNHKMPVMPLIIEDVLAGCPKNTKMPLLLATLSEFAASCFPRVITKGWRDGETHSPNIQVVIEGPAGVGKGEIFKRYKTLFQRVIANDEAKGRDDSKKKSQHIIQCVGASTTKARLMQLFRENNGVPIFVFNEEIKDITRSLNKQNGITYDMLRKAFDNGATDGSSSRGNTNPTPVSVRMNYVFTGTNGDVADFIKGEVEGGTASRILWGVLEADNKNEKPDEASGSPLESYLDDIGRWRAQYCYTTDSDGNDHPCDETCIDLEYVKVELEKWRQKQESNSRLSYSSVRKKVVKRMTSLGLHCAIVLHMLYLCQMGEFDDLCKRSVIDAVLFITEYCMERYIFKFGEEEQAIILRDINAEKIQTTGGLSTGSVSGQSKDDELTPEIQEKIKSLYIPRQFGHKAVAKEINRLFNTKITPDKVKYFLEKEGLYQPIAPNKP